MSEIKLSDQIKDIAWQGLWKNNPALVQLLGLCPLLAVTATAINGLGLGIATTLVLIGSNVTVSLIKNWVTTEIRIPVFVMIIAAFVTIIELIIKAYAYPLYLSLGIFIPLIVTNCAIIGRAEAYASKNPIGLAAIDGLLMGIGFTLILLLLGSMREILGQGTWLSGAELLLGDWAKQLTVTLFKVDSQFLFAVLPPGAFVGMGLLIALKNLINARIESRLAKQRPEKIVTRVRVTAENE
jgi:electron transport complex protein RnfE